MKKTEKIKYLSKKNKPYFIEHNLFTRKPHIEYLEHVVNLYANAAHNLRDSWTFWGGSSILQKQCDRKY